ncbi:uncharacterized protein RAG0_14381 [Rhynchosporium agropyri]|uniref:Uncharacterized protein n=1 Tax=Rhynchosporium agropyri TaxID=914238 RepID=A0A1E1LGS8_9HELO|nr:uncharacterized protein RAG0_14381 [Rhynchosporium agropyri]
MFIMEDDADWDIRLLAQLTEFAKGVRSLSGIRPSDAQHSPYGDDWDIFWPGHCGDILLTDDDRKYVIENDETVAPKTHQPWLKALKEMPENTRIVHKAEAPPQLFQHHRPAGSVNEDSDINVGHSDAVRERGVTDFIILSARLNMEQLIMGSKTYIMQW